MDVRNGCWLWGYTSVVCRLVVRPNRTYRVVSLLGLGTQLAALAGIHTFPGISYTRLEILRYGIASDRWNIDDVHYVLGAPAAGPPERSFASQWTLVVTTLHECVPKPANVGCAVPVPECLDRSERSCARSRVCRTRGSSRVGKAVGHPGARGAILTPPRFHRANSWFRSQTWSIAKTARASRLHFRAQQASSDQWLHFHRVGSLAEVTRFPSARSICSGASLPRRWGSLAKRAATWGVLFGESWSERALQ